MKALVNYDLKSHSYRLDLTTLDLENTIEISEQGWREYRRITREFEGLQKQIVVENVYEDNKVRRVDKYLTEKREQAMRQHNEYIELTKEARLLVDIAIEKFYSSYPKADSDDFRYLVEQRLDKYFKSQSEVK
jgi:ribosomal 50S subunit-associated protein YjgA (DUF615 family)